MSLKNKTRVSVRPSNQASTFSKIDVCETSGPITINFYLQHHLVWGKAALGLRQNRARTQFPMATDSSHWVIMGKTVYPNFLSCFLSNHIHKSLNDLEFWPDPTADCRVSCP